MQIVGLVYAAFGGQAFGTGLKPLAPMPALRAAKLRNSMKGSMRDRPTDRRP
jgi:hypothetical protein